MFLFYKLQGLYFLIWPCSYKKNQCKVLFHSHSENSDSWQYIYTHFFLYKHHGATRKTLLFFSIFHKHTTIEISGEIKISTTPQYKHRFTLSLQLFFDKHHPEKLPKLEISTSHFAKGRFFSTSHSTPKMSGAYKKMSVHSFFYKHHGANRFFGFS